MRCQICGAELRGALCPDCGFDRSLDRERYPTLINDGRRPEAVWVLRQRMARAYADAGTRSPGPAGAPPDAGAKAPSAAPPARQQPIDLPPKPQEQPIDSSPKPREQPAAPAKARKRRGLPFLLTAAALVLVLVLLLSKGTEAPVLLLAQGYAQSEDGLFWKLEDGVLTIRGKGRMASRSYGDAPWFAHREAITRVTIAEGVTSIGNRAFYECSSLSAITIPEGVTSVGSHTFYGCSSLKKITIPEGVTSIGRAAFAGCSSLSEITIPASVTSIGDRVFESCSSLSEITIPASVTSIGEYAFYNCSSLREITIPEGVTSIGRAAFSDCDSLRTIKVEKGNACFCVVDGVLFSKDEKTLICFPAAKTDTSYRIPEGVTSIGRAAFVGCSSLSEITIPASVTSIGEWAFYKWSSLTDVNFAGTRAQWEKIKIGDHNWSLLNAAIHYNA